ncbi:hypothetical protein TeGR_g988, partial [Tetraparma gracilis]
MDTAHPDAAHMDTAHMDAAHTATSRMDTTLSPALPRAYPADAATPLQHAGLRWDAGYATPGAGKAAPPRVSLLDPTPGPTPGPGGEQATPGPAREPRPPQPPPPYSDTPFAAATPFGAGGTPAKGRTLRSFSPWLLAPTPGRPEPPPAGGAGAGEALGDLAPLALSPVPGSPRSGPRSGGLSPGAARAEAVCGEERPTPFRFSSVNSSLPRVQPRDAQLAAAMRRGDAPGDAARPALEGGGRAAAAGRTAAIASVLETAVPSAQGPGAPRPDAKGKLRHCAEAGDTLLSLPSPADGKGGKGASGRGEATPHATSPPPSPPCPPTLAADRWSGPS